MFRPRARPGRGHVEHDRGPHVPTVGADLAVVLAKDEVQRRIHARPGTRDCPAPVGHIVLEPALFFFLELTEKDLFLVLVRKSVRGPGAWRDLCSCARARPGHLAGSSPASARPGLSGASVSQRAWSCLTLRAHEQDRERQGRVRDLARVRVPLGSDQGQGCCSRSREVQNR